MVDLIGLHKHITCKYVPAVKETLKNIFNENDVKK